MLFFHQLHHFLIDGCLGLHGTGQGGISTQILVRHSLHGYHVKIFAHTVAGDHASGKLGSLFDIVGSSGGHRPEGDLFRGTSAGQCSDLVLHLFLAHQIMIAFLFHLHGITQCSGSTGHNGDLLYRCGIGLLRCHQCVSDLMVCHDPLFLICKDGILFLITGNDYFNTLF